MTRAKFKKRRIVIAILVFAMTIFLAALRCNDYNPLGSQDKQINESVSGKACKCPETQKGRESNE